jgi:hypothetical protein
VDSAQFLGIAYLLEETDRADEAAELEKRARDLRESGQR